MPEPDIHRPASEMCTGDRPPGTPDTSQGGECTADAECTSGDNGRCVQNLGEPTFCSYDECADDAGCGGTKACACRNEASFYANVCVSGSCVVDADCGEGGYCSPSAILLSAFCREGIPAGSFGYFCHTGDDECTDDADCLAEQGCFFDVDKLHYTCFDIVCAL